MPKAIRTFLRLKTVMERVGLKRSTIYKMIAAGEFPPPIRLGEKATGFDEAELADWQAARIRDRDEGLKAKRKRAASAQNRLGAH